MPRESISSGLSVAVLWPMIDPSRTALVIIDVQVAFAALDGAIAKSGCDLSDVDPTTDQIEHLISARRAAGATVAFVRLVTKAGTDSKALKLLYERRGYREEALSMCRADTRGVDCYRLKPEAGEVEIAKLLYSSCVGTDFDGQLKAREIDTLVVTGLDGVLHRLHSAPRFPPGLQTVLSSATPAPPMAKTHISPSCPAC